TGAAGLFVCPESYASRSCREFRDLFKKGKLSCTRENDPVRDSSGKQHSNKCIMCAEKSIDNSIGFSFKIKRQHYCTQLLCL
uniref:Kazal-like domain-containing protein n=1 Tax=Anser cygnoides TaxID=8845 RepID=A0A8B9EJY1_ANSCY